MGLMLKEVAPGYDAGDVESRIQSFWDEHNIYRTVRDLRSSGECFFFVDGPPYTTGQVHLGTAWNKIIKDSVLRFLSMQGYNLYDRAGWDMHGLPIEVKVEETLGFKSKKDILSYGVDKFVEECERFARDHMDEMTEQFKRLGAWLDWDDPYMTVRDEYIEAVWWTLQQAYNKGLLERGFRVVNWCPRCETAIADSEVEYWDETDPSIYVKFPVVGEENTFIVIWTTTPWTLPANIAVAVHPDEEYAYVNAYKDGHVERMIMAHDLVEPVLRAGRYQDYDLLGVRRGSELVGMEYVHPLLEEVPKQEEFEHKVFPADFVTLENTGCVHIAPGHGVEDFTLGQEFGLEAFCPVGADGTHTEDAGKYAGIYVKKSNRMVIDDLKAKDILLAEEQITHRYGHCWRCNTPIIYLATRQWFLKISDLKEDMLKGVGEVDWYPDWAGSSRFYEWVSDARDWCISRQRYWGIPLPIWQCDDCDEIKVVGRMEELRSLAVNPDDIGDLHIPHIDQVRLKCDCSGEMHRVEDVFDVWFDSAVASWATLGYPHEQEGFETWWPADWITEGHDQTRGWFYSQLGASMSALGKPPYKSVLMHGFTLDELGRKMSKSLGNVVSPEDVIGKHGADTLRFYVLGANAPWDDLRFNWEEVNNVYRSLNIFWNVYRFPIPYMILDEFNIKDVSYDDVREHLRDEDRWLISRVQLLIRSVEDAMQEYRMQLAVRSIRSFILDDLSRWYVQLARPRTWIEKDDPDKIAAYYTISSVMSTLIRVMAPFTPFLAEEIYQNLVRGMDSDAPVSIHMCDWPQVDESLIDVELDTQMDIIQSIVDAGSHARQKAGRKLRWPVQRVIISPGNGEVHTAVKRLEKIILDQLNTKSVELLDVGESWKERRMRVVPNPGAIGPVFKSDSQEIINRLKQLDGKEVQAALQKDGAYKLDEDVVITPDMLEFEEVLPEYAVAAEFPEGEIYVNIALNEEIESEAYAKEIIRRVQDMRKQLDLQVEANIEVIASIDDPRITELVNRHQTYIATETRAETLVMDTNTEVKGDLVKEWSVEDTLMKIGIKE